MWSPATRAVMVVDQSMELSPAVLWMRTWVAKAGESLLTPTLPDAMVLVVVAGAIQAHTDCWVPPPGAPSAPAGPWGPVAPVAPAGPVAPVEPVGPVGPAGPAVPVGPGAPVGPVAPAGPCNPVGPVGPA